VCAVRRRLFFMTFFPLVRFPPSRSGKLPRRTFLPLRQLIGGGYPPSLRIATCVRKFTRSAKPLGMNLLHPFPHVRRSLTPVAPTNVCVFSTRLATPYPNLPFLPVLFFSTTPAGRSISFSFGNEVLFLPHLICQVHRDVARFLPVLPAIVAAVRFALSRDF